MFNLAKLAATTLSTPKWRARVAKLATDLTLHFLQLGKFKYPPSFN
jgi:hypothetical protein